MDAVRIRRGRELGIVRNQPNKPAFARDARNRQRQRVSFAFISLAQHDHASTRQRADCGQRIRQSHIVGEKHESRQAGTRLVREAPGQPCQLRPRKVIRQTMSSPSASPDSPAAQNLAAILSRIESSRKAALRPAPSTTLVAVSKTFSAESIRPVIAAGQRVFGENRVQEATSKWRPLRAEHPDIELHLVGPLQTNKAREAIALFDAIHSLDRPKLAETLCHEFERTEERPLLFIQLNTGEEPQKGGIFPLEAPKFIDFCRGMLQLPIYGLMCIPPVDQPPAPHFALLAKIAGEHGLEGLSMGMSADFETAIRFGATHVRIGTAIFGERE